MNDEVRMWIIARLTQWNTVFDDDEDRKTSMDAILPRLEANYPLTEWDYEEILFHLWQALHLDVPANELCVEITAHKNIPIYVNGTRVAAEQSIANAEVIDEEAQ